MHIIPLQCSQCSAPLDVPAGREQITCIWCGSILHVSQLKQGSVPARQQNDGPLQAELNKLDTEWEEYRSTWLERDDAGEYVVPEPEACRMGAWATGIIAALCAIGAVATGRLGWGFLPTIVAVGVIAVLLRQAQIGEVYQRSLENYHLARQQILRRMPQRS